MVTMAHSETLKEDQKLALGEHIWGLSDQNLNYILNWKMRNPIHLTLLLSNVNFV